MKLNLYAVRDVKSETFGSFHFLQSDGVAVRSFSQAVDDPNSMISKFPEDFVLYRLGSVLDDSGEIVPETAPVKLGSALMFKTTLAASQAPKPTSMRVNKNEPLAVN